MVKQIQILHGDALRNSNSPTSRRMASSAHPGDDSARMDFADWNSVQLFLAPREEELECPIFRRLGAEELTTAQQTGWDPLRSTGADRRASDVKCTGRSSPKHMDSQSQRTSCKEGGLFSAKAPAISSKQKLPSAQPLAIREQTCLFIPYPTRMRRFRTRFFPLRG